MFSNYPARACLFSGKPGLQFQSTQFSLSGALVFTIVGSTSDKPGETGRGGAKINEKSANFLFEVSCSQRRDEDE